MPCRKKRLPVSPVMLPNHPTPAAAAYVTAFVPAPMAALALAKYVNAVIPIYIFIGISVW
jgi:hypothetical protein